MGSILLLGVTLAVGFAVWAWASNAALSSERNFGNAIAVNTNCLNLGITIINANFNGTAAYAKLVTLWFYDNGHGNLNISNIQISNVTSGGNWVFLYGLQNSRTNTTGSLSWYGYSNSSAYNLPTQ